MEKTTQNAASLPAKANSIRKVVAFGLDARSLKMLSMIFKEKLNGICELVSDASAEVALFDMDGKDSESEWEKYQSNSNNLPTIIISIRPQQIENTTFIKKPISLPELLNAINGLLSDGVSETEEKQASATVSTASTLNVRLVDDQKRDILKRKDGISNSGYFFSPEDYALGYLQRAIQVGETRSKPVKMLCWGKKYIVFNPANKGEILTDLSDSMLRNLAFVPVDGEDLSVKIEPIESDDYFKLSSDKKSYVFSVKSFVWKLALLTARGRMPDKTDLDAPLYLQHWPNFTRLEPIPNALRMAALWIKEPRSPNNIAESLDVPLEQVLNFYSACSAIGLAGVASRKSDKLLKPSEPGEHENRGLFSSIMQRLAGKAA